MQITTVEGPLVSKPGTILTPLFVDVRVAQLLVGVLPGTSLESTSQSVHKDAHTALAQLSDNTN